jgi:serine phosphatase RsbU (regulator of sigma subunit)
MGIGGFLSEKHEFTNQELQCKTGDILYLFSDGFPDQLGGQAIKKYKYLKFREFLLSIHKDTMMHQKWLLDEEIESWKGTNPQVDDIMVMGVKIT